MCQLKKEVGHIFSVGTQASVDPSVCVTHVTRAGAAHRVTAADVTSAAVATVTELQPHLAPRTGAAPVSPLAVQLQL
jgi:hypothetical protein